MHGAAVVPESYVIDSPAVSNLKIDMLAVREEVIEYRLALRFAELVDARREGTVNVDCLLSGFWMSSNDRVYGLRIRLVVIVHAAIRVASAIDMFGLVQRRESRQSLLKGFRQRIIGSVHIGE